MFPSEPSYSMEFLQDSLVEKYDYESGESVMLSEKYLIDSFLHRGKVKYSYIFYEDKVRLDFESALRFCRCFSHFQYIHLST